jgi:hypothetical protein
VFYFSKSRMPREKPSAFKARVISLWATSSNAVSSARVRIAANARHRYTLNLRNVEVNVAPATVIVCVPDIETLIAV